MDEFLSLAEIKEQYNGQWVVVELPDYNSQPEKGKVIGSDLDKQIAIRQANLVLRALPNGKQPPITVFRAKTGSRLP